MPLDHHDPVDRLRSAGFCFMPATAFAATSGDLAADLPAFRTAWDDMPRDTYMADAGRYRRRRYAVLNASTLADAVVEAEQPHFQSVAYNRLNGGIERWFAPIAPETLASPIFRATLGLGLDVFGRLAGPVRWHVEAHQFRIEAAPGEIGKPTPEGVHRDGVDYVLVLLVNRHNIVQGTTTIHDNRGVLLDAFTLAAPFDLALVDDHRCLHGVTPVLPLDPTLPAWRDVLVLTFRRIGADGAAGT